MIEGLIVGLNVDLVGFINGLNVGLNVGLKVVFIDGLIEGLSMNLNVDFLAFMDELMKVIVSPGSAVDLFMMNPALGVGCEIVMDSE